MKRFLVSALFLALAACSQVPTPGLDNNADLAPLTFGSSGYDAANDLAKHSSGVYAVGDTYGNLHSAPKGDSDVFIRKYDTFGAVLWGKQFGTPSYDIALGVAGDSSNNAYVVGNTNGSLAGSRGGGDAFIRKYSSSGSVVWTRQFGTSSYDSATAVAVSGSNIYAVGSTGGNLAGSLGSSDGYIRKYSPSGGVVWTKQFGTFDLDYAADVAVDGSGNAYVVGYTYGSFGAANGGGADMFIRRYNASGSVTWTRQLHFSSFDAAVAVAVSGSNVYLVGQQYFNTSASTDIDVRVVKYNTSGTFLWERLTGPGSDEFVQDASADGSGVVFSGATSGSFTGTNQGDFDGFVYKMSSSGNFVWAQDQGTSAYDITQAVLVRTSSEVYAAGLTSGVLGGTQSGNGDAFLRRLRATDGTTVWTDQ